MACLGRVSLAFALSPNCPRLRGLASRSEPSYISGVQGARQSHPLPVNARAQAIAPSATMAVSARAKQLVAEGRDVLSFSAGEPDFRPPQAVTDAVAAFISKHPVGYSSVRGLPKLLDAVAADLQAFHGRAFTRPEILVTCGAKHSLAGLFLVTLSPGDEVVIPAPYWVSYPEMVRLGGGEPVVVGCRPEHGLRLAPEDLERVLTPNTRFVVLNSPCNPTGVAYTGEQLRALGEVMARVAPHAWLLCDDIYRHLVYDGFTQESAFQALSGVTEQIVVVDGVSKSHAMTGYRIGYLAGPKHIISAAARVQGQMTSGAATTSQIAAIAALTDPSCREAVVRMRDAFAARRSMMLQLFAGIPGLRVQPPQGAFYLFLDISEHVGANTRFADDIALATWLLEEHLLATVPGTPFGAPGYLRWSYATDEDSLRRGAQRLRAALSQLAAG